MSANLGSTTYTAITWSVNDIITEAKMDNMVANDQAYDSHSAQGMLLNNDKSFASKNNAGSSNLNLMLLDSSDDLVLGDTGVGLSATNLIADEDDMSSNSADKLATQQSIKAYTDTQDLAVFTTWSAARVKKAAAQSITTSTWTDLVFDTEPFDTDGYHDNSTNTDRLTVSTDGLYLVIGNPIFGAVIGSGRVVGRLEKNSTVIAQAEMPVGAAQYPATSISMFVSCVGGDYFQLGVYQTSGSSKSTSTNTSFAIVRLG